MVHFVRRSILIGVILSFCAALMPAVPAGAAGTTKSRKATVSSSRSKKKRSTSARRRKAAPPVAFDPSRPQTLGVEAAVLVDNLSGEVVWSKNPDQPRPVASLTKLMTVLVFLDTKPNLNDSTTVTSADITGAGRSHVRGKNRVALGDLLRCSLISSDNAATRALARSTGLSDLEFAGRMNDRARRMGMMHTVYHETTGLDPNNVSTAADQAILLHAATQNPLIREITSTPTYSFPCSRRVETLTNTNRLLKSRNDIVSGKTGFIRPAGFCLAMTIGRTDPRLTMVVLGARSNAGRFAESTKLINWALGAMDGNVSAPALIQSESK